MICRKFHISAVSSDYSGLHAPAFVGQFKKQILKQKCILNVNAISLPVGPCLKELAAGDINMEIKGFPSYTDNTSPAANSGVDQPSGPQPLPGTGYNIMLMVHSSSLTEGLGYTNDN